MARRSHAQRRSLLATLVATAVAALLSPPTYTSARGAPLSMQVYSTATDEQRRIVLDDALTVTLNGHTGLTVTQSPQLCEVALNHGEALFEVKPERTRPLRVLTGSTVVSARASTFSVRIRDAQNLDVMVFSGHVVANTTTTIHARQFARITPNGIIVRELSGADAKEQRE